MEELVVERVEHISESDAVSSIQDFLSRKQYSNAAHEGVAHLPFVLNALLGTHAHAPGYQQHYVDDYVELEQNDNKMNSVDSAFIAQKSSKAHHLTFDSSSDEEKQIEKDSVPIEHDTDYKQIIVKQENLQVKIEKKEKKKRKKDRSKEHKAKKKHKVKIEIKKEERA